MNVEYSVRVIKDYKSKTSGELNVKKGTDLVAKYYDPTIEKYFCAVKKKDKDKDKEKKDKKDKKEDKPEDGWIPSKYVVRIEEENNHLSVSSETRGSPTKTVSSFFKSKKKPEALASKRVVFGAPLESLPLVPVGDLWVPVVVAKLVHFLIVHDAFQSEGIFRLSGRLLEIEKIKKAFDDDEEDQILEGELDPNSVAGVLKCFLRELPNPLISSSAYTSWIEFSRGDFDQQQKKCEEFSRMVGFLPQRNQHLIRLLSDVCREIIKYSSTNMMTSGNLGIVFGPSLIRQSAFDSAGSLSSPHSPNAGSYETTGAVAKIIEFMIDHHDQIFPDCSVDWDKFRSSSFASTSSLPSPNTQSTPDNNRTSRQLRFGSKTEIQITAENEAQHPPHPNPHPHHNISASPSQFRHPHMREAEKLSTRIMRSRSSLNGPATSQLTSLSLSSAPLMELPAGVSLASLGSLMTPTPPPPSPSPSQSTDLLRLPHPNNTMTTASSGSSSPEVTAIDKNIQGAMVELKKRILDANKEIHNLMITCGNLVFNSVMYAEAVAPVRTLREVTKVLDNFLVEHHKMTFDEVITFISNHPSIEIEKREFDELGNDSSLTDLKRESQFLLEHMVAINYFIFIVLSLSTTKEEILGIAQITKTLKMLLLPSRTVRSRPASANFG